MILAKIDFYDDDSYLSDVISFWNIVSCLNFCNCWYELLLFKKIFLSFDDDDDDDDDYEDDDDEDDDDDDDNDDDDVDVDDDDDDDDGDDEDDLPK